MLDAGLGTIDRRLFGDPTEQLGRDYVTGLMVRTGPVGRSRFQDHIVPDRRPVAFRPKSHQ